MHVALALVVVPHECGAAQMRTSCMQPSFGVVSDCTTGCGHGESQRCDALHTERVTKRVLPTFTPVYGRVSKGTIMLTVTLVATTGSGIVRQRCHGSPTRCAKHDAAVRNKLFVAARRVARIVAKLAIACRRRDGLQMPSGTALPGPGPLRPSPVVACRLCRNKLIRKSAALDSSLWASLGGRERGTRVHIQILYRRPRATFEQFIFQSPKLILAGHRRVNVGTPHGALRHWQPCTHPFPTRTSLPSSQHQPRCVLSSSPPFLCMPPT